MKNDSQNNINFQQLSKKDRAQLKKRIISSVFRYLRLRTILKYGIGATAATVAILLSISIFNTINSDTSSIESYAKTLKDQDINDNVELVLGDARYVEISEDESSISYSSTGEKVQIGQEKLVSQKTTNQDHVVFNTLIVPFGKRSEIILSDGSKVWLNSGSKLIFPAHFSNDKREVYLEGEAIFEVVHRKNQPFSVKSENHEIEVLGTVFNVSNYKDDSAIYTVLQSGSVKINFAKDQLFNAEKSIRITPGTMATFDKSKREIKTKVVAAEPYFSWRNGIFIFKNDSLKSIMKKISRYYNVEIVINDKNLANETFSGYLDVKKDIDHVMQTIKETEPSNFEYYFNQDNKLIIN